VEPSELVTFRGGFVATWPVVSRLLDIEGRGATFTLLDDGRFHVHPSSVLTPDDRVFLTQRKDEARAVVGYMLTPERAM
jgi:hypothetical protein